MVLFDLDEILNSDYRNIVIDIQHCNFDHSRVHFSINISGSNIELKKGLESVSEKILGDQYFL